jgi:hypothetical protein
MEKGTVIHLLEFVFTEIIKLEMERIKMDGQLDYMVAIRIYLSLEAIIMPIDKGLMINGQLMIKLEYILIMKSKL